MPRFILLKLLTLAFLTSSFHQIHAQDGTQPAGTEDSKSVQDDKSVSADETKESGQKPAGEERGAKEVLRFAFEGTPWRDVIKWLATESDLALHVGTLPTGSFTYTDADPFSPTEAIDRVNMFLLAEGYTLVRSGRLLSVINLSDPRSVAQLDALAKLVSIDELEKLGDQTVVKCFFPLGEFNAEEAAAELEPLKLMVNPAVFPKSNQILATDTAAKLRNVKKILGSFEPSVLDNGTVMKNFSLKFVDADDFLTVARPHLGLATGESIGIDVSLSADPQGKNIFATGIADKIKIIESLLESIDKPDARLSASKDAVLQAYPVPDGNVETVYNVLVTLLAGKSMRLSMDRATSSVVALASPEIHQEIKKTVEELAGDDIEFEVIQLKSIDPYFAISLLEEMLDLNEDTATSMTGPSFDEGFDRDRRDRRDWDRRRFQPQQQPTAALEPPKIDADPATNRLFIRGTKFQIEQIKKIIVKLDVGTAGVGQDGLRILPLRGKRAIQMLETAAKFWRKKNPIILYPSPESRSAEETERVVNEKQAEPPRVRTTTRTTNQSRLVDQSPRYLTDNIRSQEPPIRCQLTPRGLIIQCEDKAALDAFEEHLRTIVGPVDSALSPPIVFYLKYTKADDALKMLAELLDGGLAARESEVGSLVNGSVSGSTYLGSIVLSRDGTSTMIFDTMTVVADTRLNRLIAQGSVNDIDRIERYLKIVDKDSSITTIETYGRSHVIELLHTRAEDVAAAIRDVYADRVSGGAQGSQARAGGGNQGQQRDRRDEGEKRNDEERRDDGERRSGGNNNSNNNNNRRNNAGGRGRSLEPKMTIAVHTRSNSLIVTAPEPLFKEVEQLAKLIDARSEQSVQVVRPLNAPAIQSMLQQAFPSSNAGTTTQSTPAAPGRSGGGAPRPMGQPSATQRFRPMSRPSGPPRGPGGGGQR